MLCRMQLIYAAGNATGEALKPDDFYSNELVKNYYKNHVSFILNHVNKYTGLQYKVRMCLRAQRLIEAPIKVVPGMHTEAVMSEAERYPATT